jgi:Transglutaminase-like superfamily
MAIMTIPPTLISLIFWRTDKACQWALRHVARLIGLPLYGTDTPGHFVMRFETQSEPVFLDPFDGGAVLDEGALDTIAQRAGLNEVSPSMVRAVSDRVMGVRLQTNLATRARARGDNEAWLRAANRRALLAPDNYQVALDYSQAAEATGLIKIALHWSEIANSLAPKLAVAQGNHGQHNDTRSQTLRYKLN